MGNYLNASIRLNGTGPYYAAEQVEVHFLNAHGWHELHRMYTEGGVQFNEAAKTVTIGLGAVQMGRVYPLRINGTYEYRRD